MCRVKCPKSLEKCVGGIIQAKLGRNFLTNISGLTKMHCGNDSGKIWLYFPDKHFLTFDSIFALRLYSGESFQIYTHDSFYVNVKQITLDCVTNIWSFNYLTALSIIGLGNT